LMVRTSRRRVSSQDMATGKREEQIRVFAKAGWSQGRSQGGVRPVIQWIKIGKTSRAATSLFGVSLRESMTTDDTD
jgi:hypothetical protein